LKDDKKKPWLDQGFYHILNPQYLDCALDVRSRDSQDHLGPDVRKLAGQEMRVVVHLPDLLLKFLVGELFLVGPFIVRLFHLTQMAVDVFTYLLDDALELLPGEVEITAVGNFLLASVDGNQVFAEDIELATE
jgi:hypothetical protein